MAFTQAHVDAIDVAISTGIRVVKYPDGSSVEYHSVADMLRARNLMKGGVDAAASGMGGGLPRTTVAEF